MSDEQTAPPQEAASSPAGAASALAPEISRRVAAILDAVEREATQLREQARREADLYFEHAKRRADALVEERRRRIAELSDALVTKSEAVVARLDEAEPVRQGFDNLVRALGDAAERLARQTENAERSFQPPPFHAVDPAAGPVATMPQQAPRQQQAPEPAAPAEPPPLAPPPPPSYPAATPTPPPASPWHATPAPGAFEAPGQASPPPAGAWQPLDPPQMAAIQGASAGATRAQVREHLRRAFGVPDPSGILDEVFGPGSDEDATVPWSPAGR